MENGVNENQPCRVCQKPSRVKRKLCKYCNTRVRRARLKLAAVTMFGGACARCGFSESPWVMEFHHIADDKEFSISNVSLSWDKMTKELNKCEMLCANCHRAEHCDRSHPEFVKAIFDYSGDLDLGLYKDRV